MFLVNQVTLTVIAVHMSYSPQVLSSSDHIQPTTDFVRPATTAIMIISDVHWFLKNELFQNFKNANQPLR